jgi:hypothetical protein
LASEFEDILKYRVEELPQNIRLSILHSLHGSPEFLFEVSWEGRQCIGEILSYSSRCNQQAAVFEVTPPRESLHRLRTGHH